MKTAKETMTAQQALQQQIDCAEISIASYKKMIDDCDSRIRAQSFEAASNLNNLSGSSLACKATNIMAFATQMAQACSQLQMAQDWKQNAQDQLFILNN